MSSSETRKLSKRKRGHPTKYTPATVAKIVQAIENGLPQKHAAGLANVDPSTLSNWLNRSEFRNLIESARSRFAARHVSNIADIAVDRSDWKASAWLLKKRLPDEFGEVSTVKQISEHVEKRALSIEASDFAGLLSQTLAVLRQRVDGSNDIVKPVDVVTGPVIDVVTDETRTG